MADTTATTEKDATFERIAVEELLMDTLDERGLDDLDFTEVHVLAVRAALEAAYEAGRQAASR